MLKSTIMHSCMCAGVIIYYIHNSYVSCHILTSKLVKRMGMRIRKITHSVYDTFGNGIGGISLSDPPEAR